MKKPEELVAGIERSIFGRALLVSILAHAVLLGGTSLQLYTDWAKYGVHSPSYINSLKTQERKEAETATRKAAAEEAAAKAAATEDGEQKTPPEEEPLPPKEDFEYGKDLSFD